jgi:hypothetical protein
VSNPSWFFLLIFLKSHFFGSFFLSSSLGNNASDSMDHTNSGGSDNAVHVYTDPLAEQLTSPISDSDIAHFQKIYTPSTKSIGQELAEGMR